MCGPIHKMKWDGTTHGLAGQRNEVSQHNLLAGLSMIWIGTVQPMDGPVQQMRQDGVTNGLSRMTNDTGWDIPLAGLLLLKKEAVQLMGGLAKEMIFSSTTYKLACLQYGVGRHNPWTGQKWDGATHGWASAANESGQHTSMADPSIIRNETVKVMDRPAKEIGLPSTTNVLAHPRYGLQRTSRGWAAQRNEVCQSNLRAGPSVIWSGTVQPVDRPVR
ncbi:hypothetical protein EDD16DRAFT_1528836 [Pisolithus croceorrhizus]|nr:hypothetical protein EDD16DRAFT_1528836 [Pisolithus croceorrhizus]